MDKEPKHLLNVLTLLSCGSCLLRLLVYYRSLLWERSHITEIHRYFWTPAFNPISWVVTAILCNPIPLSPYIMNVFISSDNYSVAAAFMERVTKCRFQHNNELYKHLHVTLKHFVVQKDNKWNKWNKPEILYIFAFVWAQWSQQTPTFGLTTCVQHINHLSWQFTITDHKQQQDIHIHISPANESSESAGHNKQAPGT